MLVPRGLPAGDGKTHHGGSKCHYPLHSTPIISLFLMALTFLASLQLAPHPKTSLTCHVPLRPASQPPHTSPAVLAALCILTALSCPYVRVPHGSSVLLQTLWRAPALCLAQLVHAPLLKSSGVAAESALLAPKTSCSNTLGFSRPANLPKTAAGLILILLN